MQHVTRNDKIDNYKIHIGDGKNHKNNDSQSAWKEPSA